MCASEGCFNLRVDLWVGVHVRVCVCAEEGWGCVGWMRRVTDFSGTTGTREPDGDLNTFFLCEGEGVGECECECEDEGEGEGEARSGLSHSPPNTCQWAG